MFPFIKEATRNLFTRPSTVEYPNKVKESPAKPGYRGRIAYDPEKCIDCGMCIKVCSPVSITKVTENVDGGTKMTMTFDLTSCTFCGTCQDFCEEGAIRMTEDYHMVGTKPEDFLVIGTRFRKNAGHLVKNDDCVYCTLCAKVCTNNAIKVDRAGKTWTVDDTLCSQCGQCVSKCPKKALSFRQELCKDDACVYCTLCAKMCPNGAITVDRAEKTWSYDPGKCVECGVCVSKCPKHALEFR